MWTGSVIRIRAFMVSVYNDVPLLTSATLRNSRAQYLAYICLR